MLVSFLYNILTIGIIVAILLISRYYSKKKNDKNSIEVLNQLTSSIYEAFITQNPFDLERFLVCDENLPKKRKNDENL